MTIKTRIDPALHEAAKSEAARQGISLTEYLRRLVLSDLLARHGGSLPVSLSSEGGGWGAGTPGAMRPR
jgi:antitoxin component of RelBE/YafQ-DinJ toxin-antitoxin module